MQEMFRHPSLITAQVLGLVTPPLSLFHTLLQWKVCLASDSFDFVSCHCPLDFTDLFFRIWPSIFSWEVPCTRVPVLSEINTVPSWCLLPRSSAVVALQNPSALSYFLLSVCIWISDVQNWFHYLHSFCFPDLLLSCVSLSLGITVYPDSQQKT